MQGYHRKKRGFQNMCLHPLSVQSNTHEISKNTANLRPDQGVLVIRVIEMSRGSSLYPLKHIDKVERDYKAP
jgi:hypothetical protein